MNQFDWIQDLNRHTLTQHAQNTHIPLILTACLSVQLSDALGDGGMWPAGGGSNQPAGGAVWPGGATNPTWPGKLAHSSYLTR